MMDDAEGLTMYLEYHLGEIELQFRLKTPLLVAIKSNSWNCFKVLVRKNADMDEYNPQNENALVIAVRFNRLETVKKLLAKGANILATDREQESVTEMAISRDNDQLLYCIHVRIIYLNMTYTMRIIR